MSVTRRPSIPAGARGLIEALAAERDGDPFPLLLWLGEPREYLRQALARWCGDSELADATTTCIVSSAWASGKAGKDIDAELPWISGTAKHHLAELARARGRAVALALRYASRLAERSSGPSSAEAADVRDRAHVRVVAAITLLPPPHAQTMTLLHVGGLNVGEVARWLMAWGDIGVHGARDKLEVGREMLEFALLGHHPRGRWPRRYPGNPKWNTPLPPPERQQ